MEKRREPHGCITEDLKRYRVHLADLTGSNILANMEGWPEFKRPMHELNRTWRLYIRLVRQEALRRGIWAP